MTKIEKAEEKKRDHRWSYIRRPDRVFYHVGINHDGTLWNPNNYPGDELRQVLVPLLAETLEKERMWREAAIKRGVEKRKRRREIRLHEAARRLLVAEGIGDRHSCYCCRKTLSDPVSIKRGIGPECWERVLRHQEYLRTHEQKTAVNAS